MERSHALIKTAPPLLELRVVLLRQATFLDFEDFLKLRRSAPLWVLSFAREDSIEVLSIFLRKAAQRLILIQELYERDQKLLAVRDHVLETPRRYVGL